MGRLRKLKMKDEYQLEARIYDRIWGKYDYDTDVKFLNELFKQHRCKSIIDVGCGTGNHALRLNKLGYEVTGVDISPTMLKIARSKDRKRKIRFIQGDMKELKTLVLKARRFDAAILLGQVSSHLYIDKEVQVFFKGMRKVLKKNGIFVLSARNAKKINEEYLNKLMLDHIINEEKLQVVMLTHNNRDSHDPNTIIWKPIYLMKENGKFDLQMREHKLRWHEFSSLKRLLAENGFETVAIYSGPSREKFNEDVHTDMWFVTRTK
jgi:ubiquinone/menaquinone biosynthesis C-methylase UbiE